LYIDLDYTDPVPKVSLAGGVYNGKQNIVISSDDPAAVIYYTLDGKEPAVINKSSVPTIIPRNTITDGSSNPDLGQAYQYLNPIEINRNTILRYFAVDSAGNVSSYSEQVYFVIPDGTNVSVGAGEPYSLIQDAINAAALTGGVVKVKQGEYNEDITVKSNVSVVGDGDADKIIIKGRCFLEDISAVKGVTLAGGVTEIAAQAKSSIVLLDNIIQKGTIITDSIFLVKNVKINDAATGLYAQNSYLLIEDSDITANNTGINLRSNSNIVDYDLYLGPDQVFSGCRGKILRTKISDCETGLNLNSCQLDLVKDCFFIENKLAIQLDYFKQDNKYTRTLITNNTFEKNGSPLHTTGTGADAIFEMNISNTEGPVLAKDGARLSVLRNYFRDRLWSMAKTTIFEANANGLFCNNICTETYNSFVAGNPSEMFNISYKSNGALFSLNNIVDGGFGQAMDARNWGICYCGYKINDLSATNKNIPYMNKGNVVIRKRWTTQDVNQAKNNFVDFDNDNYMLKSDASWINSGIEMPYFKTYDEAWNYYLPALQNLGDPWENWTLFNDNDGSYNDIGVFGGPFAVIPVIVDANDEGVAFNDINKWERATPDSSWGYNNLKDAFYSNVQDASVTITPKIPDDGYYDIYMWWPKNASLSQNAQLTLNSVYPGGTIPETKSINQSINGKQWNKVAAVKLQKGSINNIVLSGNNVAFDAVQFIRIPPDEMPPYLNNIGDMSWSSRIPRQGTFDVDREANIQFAIYDAVSGVNKNSIKLSVKVGGNEIPGTIDITGSPRRYNVIFTPDQKFNYDDEVTVQVSADDNLSPKRSVSETWSFKVISKNEFHINSGYRDIVDKNNMYWFKDKEYTQDRAWGYIGGEPVKSTRYGCGPGELDGTSRADKNHFEYKFDVDNGKYYVRLRFNNWVEPIEGIFGYPSGRSNIIIEGEDKLEGYCRVEELGPESGRYYTFVADVTDGQLNIIFDKGLYAGNPTIEAIDIEPYNNQDDKNPPYVVDYKPFKGGNVFAGMEPYSTDGIISYLIKDDESGVNPDSIRLNVYGKDIIPSTLPGGDPNFVIMETIPNAGVNSGYNYRVSYKLTNIDPFNPIVDIGIEARDKGGNILKKYDMDDNRNRVKHPIANGSVKNYSAFSIGTNAYIAQSEIMVYPNFGNHDFENGQLWPWTVMNGFGYQPASSIDNNYVFVEGKSLSADVPDYNVQGNYFLSSIGAPPGFEEDEKKGTLRSGLFKITNGEINFLLAQGTKISIKRILDNNNNENYDVLTAISGDTPYMTRKYIDVSQYIGSTVYIQVDGCTGADDFNINVSNIAKGLINPTFSFGNLAGWEIENGTAFIDQPVLQFGGNYAIKTSEAANKKGTLKSSIFILNGNTISFKIGGTQNPLNAYFALCAAETITGIAKAGDEIRKATGNDSNSFIDMIWNNLDQYIGEKLYLKIVLNDGYILISDISVNAGSELSGPNQSPINVNIKTDSPPLLSNHVVRMKTDAEDIDGVIVSYNWDFGDGTTSQLRNPAHAYINSGNSIQDFTITLTATDDDGAAVNAVKTISINPESYIPDIKKDDIPNPDVVDSYEADNTYKDAKTASLTLPLSSSNSYRDNPSLDIMPSLTQYRTLYPAGDQDWVKFDVYDTKSYRIRTVPITSGVDTVIKIFKEVPNKAPIKVMENDNYGPLNGSEIVFTLKNRKEIGTYYIQIASNNGSSITGAYRLEISYDGSEDRFEDDNTYTNATSLANDGTLQSHTFAPFNDIDWIKFEAKAGRYYFIETSNLIGGADTVLYLFADPAGLPIAFDDEGGSKLHGSLIKFNCKADGTYYIKVTSFYPQYGRGSYDISITDSVILDIQQDSFEEDNESSQAKGMLVSEGSLVYTQSHNFLPPGDIDWIRFNIKAGYTYLIQTSDLSAESDTVIAIYDENLNEIGSNDDSNGYSSAFSVVIPITKIINTETYYYVKVSHKDINNGIGDYKIKVTGFNVELTADAFEDDNDKSNGKDFILNSVQSHSLYPANDNDWVHFEGAVNKWYIIKTLNLKVGADTVIELYDANNNLLKQDDEGGLGHSSIIVWQCKTAGTYYVKAFAYSTSGIGLYDLSISDADVAAQTVASNKKTYEVPSEITSIQAAIDKANTGDTIRVAPGVYNENIDFRGKGILVESIAGPVVTILQGNGNDSVVTFDQNEPEDAVLKGFSITRGKSDLGAGVKILNASPVITENWIYGNNADKKGGGIYISGGSANIKDNTIVDNTAANYGGGIIVEGKNNLNINLNNNKVSCNTSSAGSGIAIVGADAKIEKNEIVNNSNSEIYLSESASQILANDIKGEKIFEIVNNSKPFIINNIIIQTSSQKNTTAILIDASIVNLLQNTIIGSGWNLFNLIGNANVSVQNSILWAHGSIGTINKDAKLNIEYSDVDGGYAGNGNINSNPLLNIDYSLKSKSPCINSASSNNAINKDKNDNLRNDTNGFDIGAIEYIIGLPRILNVSPNTLQYGQIYNIKISGNGFANVNEINLIQKGQRTIRIDKSNIEAGIISFEFNTKYMLPGTFNIELIDKEGRISVNKDALVIQPMIYVSSLAAKSGDGRTAATPLKTIQEAFNKTDREVMLPGTIISVSPGTYNEKINIITKGIRSYPITLKSSDPLKFPDINGTININKANKINFEKLNLVLNNDSDAITMTEAEYIEIKDIAVKGNAIGKGINIIKGKNNIIENVSVDSVNSAINISNAASINVKNSIFTNNEIGVNLDNAQNCVFSGLKVNNNKQYGFAFNASNNNKIENSKISKNETGLSFNNSNDNNVNNTVMDFNNTGVLNGGVTLDHCVIYGNNKGIVQDNNGNISLLNNIISGNNYGVNDIGTGSITENYNDIYGNYYADYTNVAAGEYSINKEAGLVNPAKQDYRIYINSACINRGQKGSNIGLSDKEVEVSNKTYYVSKVGKDTNDGITSAFAAIQKALDIAIAGDTIIINEGEYSEDLIVKQGGSTVHPLTIKGNSKVIIKASNIGIALDEISGVIIDGISIEGGMTGIKANKGTGITFRNIEIKNAISEGVSISYLTYSIFENVSISVCKNGFVGLVIRNNNILNSKIYKNEIGLSFYNSKDNNISNTIIDFNTKIGIQNGGVKIDHSVIYGNNKGIVQDTDSNISIFNSIISGNNYGLNNSSTGTILENYNIIFGNYYSDRINVESGLNSVKSAASMVNAEKQDYRIYINSACIGSGLNGANIGLTEQVVAASNKIYYVRKDGNDANNGISDNANGAFATIQKALDIAAAGDIVVIGEGEYEEDLIIKQGGSAIHPITIQGYSKVTIKALNTGITLDKVSGVVIDGIKINGGNTGIKAYNGNEITLKNLDIVNTSAEGISLSLLTYSILENINESQCKKGLAGIIINNIELRNSCFANNSETGISLDNALNCTMSELKINSNKKHGIYLNASNSNLIKDSQIYNNDIGFCFYSSKYNVVENTIIDHNISFGINLFAGDNEISINHCIIQGNSIGVFRKAFGGNIKVASSIVNGNDYGLTDTIEFDKNKKIVENYNVIYGNYYNDRSDVKAGINSISKIPGLVDPESRDFRIYVDSACIGNGENNTNIGLADSEVINISDKTYYINKNGNDANNGLGDNIYEAFASIQKALDIAYAGDKIIVSAGEYDEDIKIKRNGSELHPIAIECNNDVTLNAVNSGVALSDVTKILINNIKIKNGITGMKVTKCNDIILKNIYIQGSVSDGIALSLVSNSVFDNINAMNANNGLYANMVKYIEVRNSCFNNNIIGVNQDNTTNCIFNNVTTKENKYGFYLNLSNYNSITKSNIYKNETGISFNDSNENNIDNTVIDNNTSIGINLNSGTNGVKADHCVIYANNIAVSREAFVGILDIFNSIISNNSYGLKNGYEYDGRKRFTEDYNLLNGNYYSDRIYLETGLHSITGEVIFVDVEKRDYRIYSDSPCIGKGEGASNIGLSTAP
ncbi:right-handed parallel beta-helix repeat-containing protein, partial [Candidatus Poribacteria bacterium]|nr:right-handed parallel beta-helix repeat-containing protein [Candidatus Poribacteria bacterium]